MGLIFVALIAIVAEILTWIFVGKLLGSAWYVFFWFIAAFFIGLGLLKASASQIMPQLQQMQMAAMTGVDNDPKLGRYLTRCLAGILLMIPGLITDFIALIFLLPVINQAIQKIALGALQKRQQSMMNNVMGGAGAGGFADLMRQMQQAQGGTTIIDGEAKDVTPEPKRIDHKK